MITKLKNCKSDKDFMEKITQDMFAHISDEYGLKSGDITPMQELVVKQFKDVLFEYIQQNK